MKLKEKNWYNGAKLDVKNIEGVTPLHYAMNLDMIDIAYLLFKSGAKLPKLNSKQSLKFS
jgi:ankyrin repeat protein